ncbi:Bcr/CflA family drug resistance efflux transporter [Pseudoroseomonas deserti]|uniref:Bcr/CflA family efflux transporter n=1 Tax=Teichococcus deserti TaxID=1817963 RepID=A0A1V2H5L5_9PROT|nr:multidrug effflux MFS transporter [Pseudoroseomonas deserti]ONG56643.1 Bcr/CflA family drug resistance efflux transporter [Pseudoroseomonas deserti]
MSETPAPAPQRPPLWLLVMITTSGTVGIHIFVPALPQAAAEFGVSTGAMQLTISLYVLGLALGQLGYGPLSDALGRKPVLLAGLALYAAAGLAAALAPEVRFLIGARLLQALGGCAGLALGRAMVRDTSEPKEAASRLAMLNLAVSIGPGIAPFLGSLLAETLGWRAVFATLSAVGAVTTGLAWWRLRETRQRGESRGVAALVRDYRQLVTTPAFLGFAIGGGCATTSWYAYLAALPFILVQQLGRPVHEISLVYVLLVAGTALGNILANRLVARVGLARLLRIGSGGGCLGAFLFFGAAVSGHLTLILAVLGPLIFAIGVGLASPLALTRAVSVNPRVIGSAAGLYGFSQMAVGALCTALAGLGSDPAIAAAVVLAGAALIGQLAFAVALAADRR